MIDVFLGTKAQYIKTAPLLRLMDEREVAYRLIDSGQHARFSSGLRKALAVREPDVALGSEEDIATVAQALHWLLRYLAMTVFRPSRLNREIFSRESEICIIHGDTPSTLLALAMAKRAGKRVAHLESGLRSFRWYRPFPEELIRRLCAKFCDLHFAPSDWAEGNLRKLGVRGKVVNIGQNTNVEALYYALEQASPGADRPAKYCIVTIHRVETVLSKARLIFVINTIREISRRHHVVFVMHPPTARKIEDFGLRQSLEGIGNVTIETLMAHGDFLGLLSSAQFIITDGGSIQEEAHYLDVPCLVLRKETERREGLDSNVVLGEFDEEKVRSFVDGYAAYRSGKRVENQNATRRILDCLAPETACRHPVSTGIS